LTALSADKIIGIIKLLNTYKADGRLDLQQNLVNVIIPIYENSIILALLIRPFSPIINPNIPAKPMTTSVATLKSCGFFMPTGKGLV